MAQQFPTLYTDKTGSIKTTIFNLFNEKGTECLEMVLDGISFIASSFDSFALVNPKSYSDDRLSRYTFNKIPIAGTDDYRMELCNCRLDFHIPQFIVDTENDVVIGADLKIRLQLGKPSKKGGIVGLNAQFTLSFDGRQLLSESTDFETAYSQIQKDMLPGFRFSNCFSCHYSDYSPAGSGFFASMMCFRENKAAYLTASEKKEFFKLAMDGFIAVQETHRCDEFAPREKGTGYRGWPF